MTTWRKGSVREILIRASDVVLLDREFPKNLYTLIHDEKIVDKFILDIKYWLKISFNYQTICTGGCIKS